MWRLTCDASRVCFQDRAEEEEEEMMKKQTEKKYKKNQVQLKITQWTTAAALENKALHVVQRGEKKVWKCDNNKLTEDTTVVL